MTVSELIEKLSAMPGGAEVFSGSLGEYAPSYAPVTKTVYDDVCTCTPMVKISSGKEVCASKLQTDDCLTVRDFINLLTEEDINLDAKVSANHIKSGIGYACAVNGIMVGDMGDVIIEVGTVHELTNIERPYLTLLPRCDWNEQREEAECKVEECFKALDEALDDIEKEFETEHKPITQDAEFSHEVEETAERTCVENGVDRVYILDTRFGTPLFFNESQAVDALTAAVISLYNKSLCSRDFLSINLRSIEDYVKDNLIPYYINKHKEVEKNG